MTIFDSARALLAASLQDSERLAQEFREYLDVESFHATKAATGLSQQALVDLRDQAHHGRGIRGAQQAANVIATLPAAQPPEQPVANAPVSAPEAPTPTDDSSATTIEPPTEGDEPAGTESNEPSSPPAPQDESSANS